ncbi:DUF5392 family protein [Sediminibacillus massiliensis]|uniref:DUF5392 family protein n=1 Tax=Sediminibacillus massiliensis TaxID=1926277 RepID=UPI0009886E32|nr:DUF5392 family protein [Sediminibacillus massiliensis]
MMKQEKMDITASVYVKKELENFQNKLMPFMKKTRRMTFISIPLITFSVINLFFLLFQVGISQESAISAVIISLAGAIGFALFKETLHKNKEIANMSLEYMKDRIAKE